MTHKKLIWGGVAATLGALLLLILTAITSKDFDLTFVRELESEADSQALSAAFYDLNQWPNWFYSLKDAKALDYHGNPVSQKDQFLMTAQTIRLAMDPKKGRRKEFQLILTVLEFTAGKSVSLGVVSDSSGRLTRFFSRIEWRVEIIPTAGKPLIRGTAIATTSHWRSRFFGMFFQRMLMNQIFYPHLIHLAAITRPHDPVSFSVTPQ